MPTISAGDFRKGMIFEMEGKPMLVVDFQHVKPGKGAAFVRTKYKNVITGAIREESFNPTAKFEEARREVFHFGGVVENVDYGADVLLSALVPEEQAALFAAHILDASAGTIQVLEAGEQLKDVPWREPVRKD